MSQNFIYEEIGMFGGFQSFGMPALQTFYYYYFFVYLSLWDVVFIFLGVRGFGKLLLV